ncbi:hypothetical protein BGW38_002433 [Lunasporangiospora selenospora]|uniref:Uncharacterized protein n=1 Tax=Lunasporangiospora selenospora TaxID=979761 RepID=A0A9P6KCX0_9FUNG|nr:hypothetical protein BGW38_002433 [Lunasporangiospora selenospora]
MDRSATPGYGKTSNSRYPSGQAYGGDSASPSGYRHDNNTRREQDSVTDLQKSKQPLQSSQRYTEPTFVVHQSTSASNRAHPSSYHTREAQGPYQYNSASEDDQAQYPSQEPALLGDLQRAPYRARRDSGLPPIKLSAAKKLPPFPASLSSNATGSLIEEDEGEDEDGDPFGNGGESSYRRTNHQGKKDSSLPVGRENDRGMDPRQIKPQSKHMGNGSGSDPSSSALSPTRSSLLPFPSLPARAAASSSLTQQGNHLQDNSTNDSDPSGAPRREMDRGPADLSNPSTGLAAALLAGRSQLAKTHQSRPSAQQPQQQQRSQQQPLGLKLSGTGRKLNYDSVQEPTISTGHVRIPVPDIASPVSRAGHEHMIYQRRTSFTLSPTSSNPELAESQTDSQSGSYDTPQPEHSLRRNGVKYGGHSHRTGGPSISSNMSAFSDDYRQPQPRPQTRAQHHRESSLLGTSYDSVLSGHREGNGVHSRYTYAEDDPDQSSLPSQSYTETLRLQARYNQGADSSSYPHNYTNHGRFGSSMESDRMHFPGQAGKSISRRPEKLSQHDHRSNGRSDVTPVGSYPHQSGGGTAESTHSLEEEDDLQDQLTTEAEYIMTRNTELLKILNVRDEEIQTLQQELDHTLKVMHEYEDDLMAMHTAAAKPYESYHTTLDQIGHEMTQQDALVQGYQLENEKLTSQLKSSMDLRQEAEKRHLRTVESLKTEITQLRQDLDNADQEHYGRLDLRVMLNESQDAHERSLQSFKDKEEEYIAEVGELKTQLQLVEQTLEDERKAKVEEMQKIEKDFQDVRAGFENMMKQMEKHGPGSTYGLTIPSLLKRGSCSSSADDGQADTTAGAELERDIGLLKASLLHSPSKSSATQSSTPSPPLSEKHKTDRMGAITAKDFDRKLISTESLTTANPADGAADIEKLDLEQRISKFESDMRQSLLRTISIESFASMRSSVGTAIPPAAQVKKRLVQNQIYQNSIQAGTSRDDVRTLTKSEEQGLASKLRDRIGTLSVENRRLRSELAAVSQTLRHHQAERQRKVAKLEEDLDLHENAANLRLDDINSDEGQLRVRKVIQGLLVRIRTKEAETEFYHNAYLDKVLELDQLALATGKNQDTGGLAETAVDALVQTGEGPLGAANSSVIETLEARMKELERSNMELSFRLAAEQRRSQATESENATLVREKLTIARTLEDQIEQLQDKLSAVEIAKAKLADENRALKEQKQQGSSSDHDGVPQANGQNPDAEGLASTESMTIMRTRLLSLTRQRDQLREQLQEAFDIQLALRDQSSGGVPDWTVDDFKRLEQALDEKSSELGIWKERAIALERVVERIRMIKDRPEPIGLSMGDRSSAHDSDSMSSSSVIGSSGRRRNHQYGLGQGQHHTLEELDQVVLKLEHRLERRDQELQEVVMEAKRQTDVRLEAWKAKWVQVVQRKNAEIHRFQTELEALMAAVDRDRARMAASMKKQ